MHKSRIRIVFWMVLFCQFVLAGNGVFSSIREPASQTAVQVKKEVTRHCTPIIDQYFEPEDNFQEETIRKTILQVYGADFFILSLAQLHHLQLPYLSANLSDNFSRSLFLRHRNLRI